MTLRTLDAQQVTGPWAGHGEGAVWDHAAARLRWVDIFRGDVLSWAPGEQEPIRWHVSQVATAIRRRRSGGFAVATGQGFSLLAENGLVSKTLGPLWADDTIRMNDGACDPQGRFFCGAMEYNAAPGVGFMHRLDGDHTATRVLRGLTIPNGLAFTDDGRQAFLIDSPTQSVTRYTVNEAGGLHEPVVVLRIPAEHGEPDGMTIDADGGFWIAMWDGSAVRHYGPDGEPLSIIPLPVSRPTSCTFGGPDGQDLYITSSSHELEPSLDEPAAGAIFMARTDSRGRAEELFAG